VLAKPHKITYQVLSYLLILPTRERGGKMSRAKVVQEETLLEWPPPRPNFEFTPGQFKFIDLFAGVGGMRLGFEAAGGECVFTSEWDKDCQKTYEANFGDKPDGDITKIDERELPDFDVLLAGFPCQPFSSIGQRQGFKHETREQFLRRSQDHSTQSAKSLPSRKRCRSFDT
jgi:hypothetical protein